ncbi:MAG: rhodanese-like domain-containing protein [Cytophagales bacterium]|tara:strand:- start:29 stop:412 length:384 start_codon:yes stop_codon:yes gene_type:complete
MRFTVIVSLFFLNQITYDILPDIAYKNIIDSDNKIILIDVRSKKELDEIMISGVLNYDFNSDEFEKSILSLDIDKTYYVICRSGRRSGITTELMLENGFENVFNIKGGMIKWIDSNLKLSIKKGHNK